MIIRQFAISILAVVHCRACVCRVDLGRADPTPEAKAKAALQKLQQAQADSKGLTREAVQKIASGERPMNRVVVRR